MPTLEPFIRPEESEASFRRYELVIAEFVTAFRNGKPYTTNSGHLSVTTFCVRFRDAVRGFLKHKYPSSSVNHDQLDAAWSKSIIRPISDSMVYIGPKECPQLSADKAKDDLFLPVDLSSDAGLFAPLAQLMEASVIGPFRVTCKPEHKEYITNLSHNFDIAILWENPTTFLLT